MPEAVTWNLNHYIVMGVFLGLFGVIGFRRGVNRELLSVIGISLGIIFSSGLAPALTPQINRFYKLARFAVSGGLTSGDPAAAWHEAQGYPVLLESPQDMQVLGVVLFFLTVLLFYAIGQVRIAPPNSFVLSILGLFTGAINGFLMAYYLVPIIFPTPEAVITVQSAEVQQTLTSAQTVARVVAFFVFVLIALGLYSASSPRQRQ